MTSRSQATARPAGLLAGMRVRKKLIFLHTCFWLLLAGVLVLALRPAVSEVVRQAEVHEARLVLGVVLREGGGGTATSSFATSMGSNVQVRAGSAEALGIDPVTAQRILTRRDGEVLERSGAAGSWGEGAAPVVAMYDAAGGRYLTASVILQGARDAVVRLYVLMIVTLLGVYALVAVALEALVLPRNVYTPIRRILEADRAVQERRKGEEIIPESAIPADELGEIMRSRNRSVLALRRHESDLASALSRLEDVASDLKRKNHLLETAQRNLADADRLASLGMMSAGIAHELNTPLAVIKGLVEKLHAGLSGGGEGVTAEQAALMVRVVGRLERLSESLLDFARVRPATSRETLLRPLVDEAWTLVQLERAGEGGAGGVEFVNQLPSNLRAFCDGDRIVQVLVNLIRNAVDAMTENGGGKERRIEVSGGIVEREVSGGEGRWVSVTVSDTGPGIGAELMSRLFQPFVSSRLDAHGTGLGLAVAEGIVREHGGLIVARNRAGRGGAGSGGAVFEVLLPERGPAMQEGERS